MTLSILGLVALVAYSSWSFSQFAFWATLSMAETLEGAADVGESDWDKAISAAVHCGLSFFGALALLGSLLV